MYKAREFKNSPNRTNYRSTVIIRLDVSRHFLSHLSYITLYPHPIDTHLYILTNMISCTMEIQFLHVIRYDFHFFLYLLLHCTPRMLPSLLARLARGNWYATGTETINLRHYNSISLSSHSTCFRINENS